MTPQFSSPIRIRARRDPLLSFNGCPDITPSWNLLRSVKKWLLSSMTELPMCLVARLAGSMGLGFGC